ncbi:MULTISPECIES: hypothetical protein [unclassified Synechococcus]|jgi:hypothetical protein|uniref:hypothetical protein n=1 Tax=unclassified Synechococcus TaxID=2626047 RepID=UPI001302FBD8|nr:MULTISPECIES: hypothetical protein [unclassified Synechococcus]MCP9846094.1 hypothetical protein [Synechococcus sp. Lug-A]MCT0210862.1 hypothetical protein [Synechococcus sp. CS-1333]
MQPGGRLPEPSPEPPVAVADSTPAEPVLCQHCGRTASNGIACQGSCVADSGY